MIFLFHEKLNNLWILFMKVKVNPIETMPTKYIVAPPRPRYHLIFDVETTGKLPKIMRSQPAPKIEEYPYILQLSYLVYDLYEHKVVDKFDSYVKVPDHIEISPFIQGLTGITKEKCAEGLNIIDVLDRFYEAYVTCDCLVAHNIDFDTKMLQVELERNRKEILATAPYCTTILSDIFEKVKGMDRYCTMRKGVSKCEVYFELSQEEAASGKKPSKKWPTLVELHRTLFNEVPEGLHNSMVDVIACTRCYLKMRHGYDGTIRY
jgi:DNA polymerase III epsilon subunit-like protein